MGNRIAAVNPPAAEVPAPATEIDLGDVTLLPGLMDMELNLVIGGPFSGNPRPDVEESPSFKTLRGAKNARTTLDAGLHHRAQPRPVPEDRRSAARRRPRAGRSTSGGCPVRGSSRPGTRSHRPVGTSIPTMFQRLGPGIMPLSVEEGIANGVAEVRARGPLPGEVRRQGHQGVGVGRRDVARRRPAGRAALLPGGVRRDRGGGPPPRGEGRRARDRRRRDPRVHPRRHRLHRARVPRERRDVGDDGRARHVPRVDDRAAPTSSTSRSRRRRSARRRRRSSPRRRRCSPGRSTPA